MTRKIGALALMLGLLSAAPAAAANTCAAAPGTAAVDQYCESVPGSTSSSPPSHGHHQAPVPSSTAAAVRSHPGGPSVLQNLPAQPAATPGSPSAGSPGGRHRAAPVSPKPRRGLASEFVAPAPHGTLAGLKSAGGSLFSGDMAGVMAILALTLLGAMAIAVRRRSAPDR